MDLLANTCLDLLIQVLKMKIKLQITIWFYNQKKGSAESTPKEWLSEV